MHTLLSLTTLLAFWSDATTAADAAAGVDPSKAVQRIPMVRLRIDGLSSDDDGKAVMKALSLVPNIKVATRPTMKDPTILVGPLRGATYDLGDLAKAVAGVKPSGTKHSASTSLVFDFRPRDGKIVSEAALKKMADAALAKIDGVDAKHSKVDFTKKQILVRLSPKGGAAFKAVCAAFPDLEFVE